MRSSDGIYLTLHETGNRPRHPARAGFLRSLVARAPGGGAPRGAGSQPAAAR